MDDTAFERAGITLSRSRANLEAITLIIPSWFALCQRK